MTTIRATFLICATILASVFAVIFYGYQQEQYVITSSGNFVSIFDRKSKTLNICDKGNCTHISPMFESHTPIVAATNPQASLASQIMSPQLGAQPAQRLIGSFPQAQGPVNPQIAGGAPQVNPQVGNPPANPQMVAQNQMPGQQPVAGVNPQAQQMLAQLHQMEVMAQQTANQPMTPQRIQQIRQRRSMEDQALAGHLLNPQMIQQVQQLRAMEDQQMAHAQQAPSAQAVSGNAQGGQVQLTGGAPEQQAANAGPEEKAGGEEGTEEPAADEPATEEKAPEENKAEAADEKTEEAAAGEETEEAAPV